MLRASFFNAIDRSLNDTITTNPLLCEPCPKDCCPANTTCVESYVDGVGYDYSCMSSDVDYTPALYILMGMGALGGFCIFLTCCYMLMSKCQSTPTQTGIEEPLVDNPVNFELNPVNSELNPANPGLRH